METKIMRSWWAISAIGILMIVLGVIIIYRMPNIACGVMLAGIVVFVIGLAQEPRGKDPDRSNTRNGRK